ncbi:MAG TPA: hypothetical protein VE988_29890 [Gemmataceae bacterium]|nr:hypothetical protein [Gemmataceae bacterium]
MPFFGYSKHVVGEHGLHELSEVTFNVPLIDIRRIASFLIACANRVESGEWESSHCHLTAFDKKWDDDNPDSDIIVIHPSPQPPKRVN